MKTALVLLVLASLALAAPLASAQMGGSAALSLSPPDQPVRAGNTTSTTGTITYTTDLTASIASMHGVTVQYSVTNVPEWLTVVVSPSSDIIHMPLNPGVTQSVTKMLTITMDSSAEDYEGALGLVELVATITPSAPGSRVVTAKASMPVRLAAAEPCEDEAHAHVAPPASSTQASGAAPDVGTAAPETTSPSPVKVQSAAPPVAPASYLAVAGFAVAGAGAGFLLRRRL